jgi:hydroxylaminobenzene mutase
MQDLLLVLGLVLFLLGLLTGLVAPVLKNPRMGVASHLQGMTNGPFLIVVGLMWPRLQLSHASEVLTVALLAYGTYANWLATQLGSLWGAGHRFAPGAAGEHRAGTAQERTVDLLLTTLAPAMIAATVLLILGLLR